MSTSIGQHTARGSTLLHTKPLGAFNINGTQPYWPRSRPAQVGGGLKPVVKAGQQENHMHMLLQGDMKWMYAGIGA